MFESKINTNNVYFIVLVKKGFTGEYINLPIFAVKHRFGVLVRTALKFSPLKIIKYNVWTGQKVIEALLYLLEIIYI